MSDVTRSTLSLAANIVASFVSNNTLSPGEIAGLLQSVKAALEGSVEAAAEPAVQEPAHSLRRLVTPDAVFCAECGKKFKSLRRHLMSDHALTPDAYRARWGLNKNSPMVAPNYSAARSELAKSMGLGQDARKTAPAPVKRNAEGRAKPRGGAPPLTGA